MRNPAAWLAAAMWMLPVGAWAADAGALAEPAPVSETRDLLSRHETVAVFNGLEETVCRGLTARCPLDCGDSGTLAKFKILEYLAYEKPGKYGDPKAETFQFLLHDNKGNPKVKPAIRDAVLALKPGEKVLLSWNHDYVHKTWPGGGKSNSPERPVTKLERAPAEGVKPPAEVAKPPAGGAKPPAEAAAPALDAALAEKSKIVVEATAVERKVAAPGDGRPASVDPIVNDHWIVKEAKALKGDLPKGWGAESPLQVGSSEEKDSGWDALKPGARGLFYLTEPNGPASSPPYFRLLKFVPAAAAKPEPEPEKAPPDGAAAGKPDEIVTQAKATMKKLEAQKAAGRRAEANRLQRELQMLKKHMTAKQLEALEKEAPEAGGR